MSLWKPTTYTNKNWSYYNDALKQRGSLSIWFDAETPWKAKLSGQHGRQKAYSDVAIQSCLTLEVLFGFAFAADNWFRRKLAETRWVGLDGARL